MALFTARVQAFILQALIVIKLIQGMTSLPVNGASWGQQTDESIVVRQGVLFQTKDCPWAMSKAEMLSRRRDDSIQGNTILMTSQAPGRTGNRFADLSQFLAMGYCCRSKLLELPLRDSTIPDRDGGHLTSGSNLFDFSTVDMMPIEEFRNISDRADVCPQLIKLHGHDSMQLEGIHPDLLSCMNRVYLRGCEAAYLGRLVETWNVCPAHGISTPRESFDKPDAGTAGSLVIHIRSGDVFRRSRLSSRHGQPPLQFYLDAIDNQPWSEVSVLTFAETEDLINPTYSRLQEMKTEGLLGKNVNFFMNRQFAVDLEAMLCADGIALARSSLALLISAHGRASYFYVPSECGPGIYAREVRSKASPRILMDNTTLLALERPDAEVYGIEWKTGPSAYSVYTSFKNTPLQRAEMLDSYSIKGLEQCHIGS